jgi:4-amino-4-deoxy-L-arabinose transferase-like glycosyltransferase
VTQRRAWILVAAVAGLPRLVVLLHERASILSAYTEKSDDFARTFVHSGTFGFIPGEPSAYTQPLYAFFLIPIYWIFGRSWAAVGLIQIGVAVATALLVYEIGRRFVSRRIGLVAAIVATLNPYLVWHDVHVNREILDQLLAVAAVLLALVAVERRGSLRWSAALGAVLGLAILGNTRLVFLPLVFCGFLLWRRVAWWPAALVLLAACVLVVTPWVVRNRVSVGCLTLTTDTRALWKANNPNTYGVLARGGWIDDVPPLPNQPPTPEDAFGIYKSTGRVVHVDECGQMTRYQHLVFKFWREHPGEKAKLAGQAARMLWDPRSIKTMGRAESGGFVDTARSWAQPLYSVPLFALGLVGLFLLPRRVAWLFVALLAYQTLAAMGFAGATRYRVPWDFTLAIAASATLWWLVEKRRAAT